MAGATSTQNSMNSTLKKQEYIQLFSVNSTLNKNTFVPLEYAVLYENFEADLDPDASAHLWLYPASSRNTPQLYNFLQNTLNKVSNIYPSYITQISKPTLIQLKKEANGKPHFEPPYEKIAVSFSYTQQFGLLGLSTKTTIGVDMVEAIESFKISEVVNSHFHFSEQLFLKELNNIETKNWFFNAWALKEAALKSIGEGITSGGLGKIIVGLMNESYIIKEGFEKEKAFAGSITLKRSDTELVIGVSVLK